MNINKYELKQDSKRYIFITSIKDNSIHFSIENPSGKIYTRNISLEYLHSLDKIFEPLKSEIESLEFLDQILKDHKVSVVEENENLKLVFYIKTEERQSQFEIFFGNLIPDINTNINIDTPIITTDNIIQQSNYMETLPTKYLPTKIIESTENPIYTQENIITNFITENTQNINYITETPIILPPQISTEVHEVHDTNIETSILPAQNYITHTYDNNMPISRNSIEINTQNEIKNETVPLIPLPKNDEISNLIDDLNKLKKKEIESLKRQMKELSEFNLEEKEKEDQNEILLEKIKEIEQYRKAYEKEINKLHSTLNSQSINKTPLDSQNITFEHKSEKILIKGEIIQTPQELELITRKINLNLINDKSFNKKKIILNLLYKASVDNDKSSTFHKKCDRAKNTLILIETEKGRRFGGYTSVTWKGDCLEKKDKNAFIFSLDKMKIYDVIKEENAIGCFPKFGPIFMGCQIRIYDKAFIKGGTTFEKGKNYNTEEDYELNGGERTFKIKEIEVYEVTFV